MVSKIPDHWYSLQIEIPDDCNAFKLDWSDALAKNVKWALSVFKLLSKYSSYFEKDANSHQWERFPCANKDKMLLCVSRHEICKPTLLKCNILFSSFLWSGNVTISFWKKNVRAECEANFRFLVSKHCRWPYRILIRHRERRLSLWSRTGRRGTTVAWSHNNEIMCSYLKWPFYAWGP